ncbi:MAG TPA: hypothetical protein VJM50_01815 [Pyrinomonadaceae bacterium]|nr:hypothetical protein [Pyrinomonadaceae bacterium]
MTQTNSNATKIMIIRHAEKPPPNPPPNGVNSAGEIASDSLIVQGWQRAGALVVLFAPSKGPLQHPDLATPQHIYATSSPNDEGNRPEETVMPLLDKLQTAAGQLIGNFGFQSGDVKDVAASARNCQGVVLISWPHGQIPDLAKQIPLSPNNKHPVPTGKWPSDRFDMVWVFDLDTSSNPGGYTFKQVPQLLLAGDSSEHIT